MFSHESSTADSAVIVGGSLGGLTMLSDETAEALTRHRSKGRILSLDGLTTLSETGAQALARHTCQGLSLDGLNHAVTARSGDVALDLEDVVAGYPGREVVRVERLEARRGARMSMIFQEPMTALNPVERIGDQIGEVLEIHSRLPAAERRRRVLDVMSAVKLPDVGQLVDA